VDQITVLLAEDHTIVREGLVSMLEDEPDVRVVGQAGDGQMAVTLAEQLQPNVVVMDITMPVLNGLEATRQIKRYFPQTQVVILTVHTTEEYIYQILQAGASGYVVKQAALDELVMAIRAAHSGQIFLSPTVSSFVVQEYIEHASANQLETEYDLLTEREREVLQLVAEGYSTREIAERLVISVKTVESHRANLMNKLNIHNIAGLTKYAIGKGLVSLQ
jgi:DNA-binding NarL/FixJ family response regulator